MATTSTPDFEPADPPVELCRQRSRCGEARSRRLSPRFTVDEFAQIETAAASVGMTANGFCAESAVAAARGTPMVLEDAQYREELARLQRQLFEARTAVNRIGTDVNQAAAAINSTGAVPEWMSRVTSRAATAIERLDWVIAEVDRRLR